MLQYVAVCNTNLFLNVPFFVSGYPGPEIINKTCHRDRIARLTAPCPSHKTFNVKTLHFASADAAAQHWG